MELFKLFGIIAINNSEANQAIDETTGNAENSSNKMIEAFKKVGKAVMTYFAVDKIVNFGKEIVQTSATVNAEMSAFEQIMGDYSDNAQTKMNEVADATGAVSTRLTPYMTSLTAKFKGLGYDIDKATTLASDGLMLASDASAFWDKSLDDSMSALNSFINGSYEGGEAIGLFANDTQMASYAVKQGIVKETKAWSSLDEAKKQATRLEYAKTMFEASGAVGQASKEADQYANVQANLTEKWRQFKAQIGEPLLQNVVLPAMEKLSGAVDILSQAFKGLKDGNGIEPLIAKIQEGVPVLMGKITSFMSDIGTKIKENLPSIISKGLDMIEGLVDNIAENLPTLLKAGMDMLKNIVQGIMDALPELISRVPEIVTKIANLINDNFPLLIRKGFEILVTIANGIIQAIPTLIQSIPKIIQAIIAVWEAVQWVNLGKKLITGIKNGITNLYNGFKDFITNSFDNIKNSIKNIFTQTGSQSSSIWNNILNAIKNIVTKLGNSVKNIFSNLLGSVKNTWNNILNAIKNPIETAKNFVKSALDKMKGFFNFTWQLPKIKLPHFKISGSFSLNPPSIPTFGVDWYKKAYDNPMILNSPTLFGYSNGKFLGGGDGNGGEVIVGQNTLMNLFRSAIHEENSETSYILQNLRNMLYDMLFEIISKLDRPIVLNDGTLISVLTPGIDEALGEISDGKVRGR